MSFLAERRDPPPKRYVHLPVQGLARMIESDGTPASLQELIGGPFELSDRFEILFYNARLYYGADVPTHPVNPGATMLCGRPIYGTALLTGEPTFAGEDQGCSPSLADRVAAKLGEGIGTGYLPDARLDCLVGWPEGTCGHRDEMDLIRRLNEACLSHGYGRLKQLVEAIHEIWEHPLEGELRHRKLQEHHLARLAKNRKADEAGP